MVLDHWSNDAMVSMDRYGLGAGDGNEDEGEEEEDEEGDEKNGD